jgi:hypothetical protein
MARTRSSIRWNRSYRTGSLDLRGGFPQGARYDSNFGNAELGSGLIRHNQYASVATKHRAEKGFLASSS